ncbi:uncharacterized protein LOC131302611 isoform X2 [Rhododendron vialii]|uniref:uncharacterized protein LOC131302611 isoform X2 n=1 Tax=Rhododendron vialii TaxID=182163 RepID=UPI00265F20E7|nr:uncharacterized protein LOC131302611 isoform X2 [Rhododendron vialii]
MASSLLSLQYAPSMPSVKQTSSRPSLQIRAQGFKDEGSIDGNMSILRERIQEVRIKERLERCCRKENGWNYAAGHDYKHKRSAGSSQFLEVFGMVFGTLGLTIVTGSLCLWLVSLFIQYLYQ